MTKKHILMAGLLVVAMVSLAVPTTFANGYGHTNKKVLSVKTQLLNRVVTGTVTTISGNTITLTNKENVLYTVDASSAKVMKAGAEIAVSAIQVGDTLKVIGTVSGTNVVAKSILDGILPVVELKDGNIVVGTVASVTGNSFVAQNQMGARHVVKTVTVNTDANTTFKKNGRVAVLGDLAAGQKVMVKGVKDAATGVVTAKSVNIVVKKPAKKAKFIKALKMHKGNDVMGTVSSVNANSFVVQLPAKKDQQAVTVTVNTDANTVFKKDGVAALLSDVVAGLKVMVKGTKDATTGVVTAKSVNLVTKMSDECKEACAQK